MAVSSIFHNVILDTPEKVEAFISAMEAHPYVRPEGMPKARFVTDPEEIARIHELREKNRKVKKKLDVIYHRSHVFPALR